MAYTLDPEIGGALAALAEAGGPPVPERGDWRGVRESMNGLFAFLAAVSPAYPDVETKDFEAQVPLRWYTKKGAPAGPAVVYLHGGGLVSGDVTLYDPVVAGYVSGSGVPFLSVDYRLAPEFPGTAPAEDAYAALLWLIEHADELGVDPERIAIMGDSGGGGIAAAVAILARDRGTALAKQILIYPMLDDRTVDPNPEIAPYATWTYDHNYTGWSALLGDDLGTDRVSPIAAPARNTDFAGLTPAYIEVGELDIFRDEDIEYARKLALADIPVELHVHPGAPHAFERLLPSARISERSAADRLRVLQTL